MIRRPIQVIQGNHQEFGDHARGDRHQDDRDGEAEDEDERRALGDTRDGQHVVERHGDVGERDRRDRAHEAQLGPRATLLDILDRMPFVRGDLPVHFPADPQEQQASGEREADDLEKLRRDRREQNAQHHGRGDAPEDHPVADLGRNARSGESDDDRVVAGEHDVDHDDLDDLVPVRAPPLRRGDRQGLVQQGRKVHVRYPRGCGSAAAQNALRTPGSMVRSPHDLGNSPRKAVTHELGARGCAAHTGIMYPKTAAQYLACSKTRTARGGLSR